MQKNSGHLRVAVLRFLQPAIAQHDTRKGGAIIVKRLAIFAMTPFQGVR
tara:strand:- start:468 stop:614 length:147 start_codon:yes stop_codon:yes gene_type:complete